MKNTQKSTTSITTFAKQALCVLAFTSSMLSTGAVANERLKGPVTGLDSNHHLPASANKKKATGNEQKAEQRVNINLASYEQLVALPGIGKVKATAIIKYRKEVGMFKVLEDIQNIKGIGVKLFAKLQDKIKV